MTTPSFHITGCYPIRVLSESDRADYGPPRIVRVPCGFEPLEVAVYGGTSRSDDCEAVEEFLVRRGWCQAGYFESNPPR